MRGSAKALIAVAACAATFSGASTAFADAPITVTINSPGPADVSYISAHLSGAVNPHGGPSPTFWHFEYSETGEAETWVQFDGGGEISGPDAEGSVSVAVESTPELAPGHLYFVRLVAFHSEEEERALSDEPNPSFTTKTVPPAAATIEGVGAVTGTSAHFSGKVEPEGTDPAFNVSWRFECTPECSGLQGGFIEADTGEHTVTADATGLEPNTHYEVSLIASNAGGPIVAGPVGFETDPVDPVVQTLYAGSLGTEAATLAGSVNPKNSAVTYRFEWGTGIGYGNVVPAIAAPVGAEDDQFHVLTAPISGLQPGATYHFRIVATNTETSSTVNGEDHVFTTLEPAGPPAPECPNSVVRDQQHSEALPDCRAYEQVSPPDKNGADARSDERTRSLTRASVNGDALAWYSRATAGEQASGNAEGEYLSHRGAAGWTTEGINAPLDPVSAYPVFSNYSWFNPDLSKAVVATYSSVLAPGAADPFNTFIRDNATGTYQPISLPTIARPPTDPSVTTFTRQGYFEGASEDLSHIVFLDARKLVGDAPPDDPNQVDLYEWSDGQLRLVSVLPGGSPVTAPDTPHLGIPRQQSASWRTAVSADGSRIFFGESGTGGLFVREDGTSTRLVSSSEVTGADASEPKRALFSIASADGSVAFFTSVEKLTNDATVETSNSKEQLYRWDGNAPAGERLTDLTKDDPAGTVLGVAGASKDASLVYLVDTGVLAPGAVSGQPNLYLWRQGAGLTHVATLDGTILPSNLPADSGVWSDETGNGEGDTSFGGARVTPDGSHLLFLSRARLTSYDNGGYMQAYLFDADTTELVCVSCNPTAARSTGDVSLVSWNAISDRSSYLRSNLTDDGNRIFFESPESLVHGDSNGRLDVYEWEDGRLALISSGQADIDSYFVDSAREGADAFFRTRQRLVGGDHDELYDIYDARTDGGYAEPIPEPACEGDACLTPPVVPNDPTPASAGFSGPGNVKPDKVRCSKGKVRRKGHCVAKRQKKGKKKNASDHRRTGR